MKCFKQIVKDGLDYCGKPTGAADKGFTIFCRLFPPEPNQEMIKTNQVASKDALLQILSGEAEQH